MNDGNSGKLKELGAPKRESYNESWMENEPHQLIPLSLRSTRLIRNDHFKKRNSI